MMADQGCVFNSATTVCCINNVALGVKTKNKLVIGDHKITVC